MALNQTPTILYTPESQLRRPRKLLGNMWRDLMASRELAWRLTVRDIHARYRQAILGVAWAFLPLFTVAGLFVGLRSANLINVGDVGIPYPAFVLIGTLFWQLFTESINAPLKMVVANKPLLAKINFPREAMILSGMGQVLFDFCIKLLLVPIVFIVYKLPITWGLLLTPMAILMILLLGTVVGLMLTPIGVLFSDIASGLPIIISFWVFVTPVAYEAPKSGLMGLLFKMNPVSPLVVAARDLVTKGSVPDILAFSAFSGVVLLCLFLMWLLYRLSLPILIERIGA